MIEICHVSKRYPQSGTNALDDVSLTIESGAFFGLLGPNGAGKTTLISILSTLLLPSAGEIRIDGGTLGRRRGDIKRKLALITQHNSLRSDMTLDQIMELQGRLYGIPQERILRRREELLAFCALTGHRNKTVRRLSGGMKRRVGIAQAMLNDPEILILDEPTAGLDPNERIRFRNLLSGLSQDRLVLLSTHIVSDVE